MNWGSFNYTYVLRKSFYVANILLLKMQNIGWKNVNSSNKEYIFDKKGTSPEKVEKTYFPSFVPHTLLRTALFHSVENYFSCWDVLFFFFIPLSPRTDSNSGRMNAKNVNKFTVNYDAVTFAKNRKLPIIFPATHCSFIPFAHYMRMTEI